MATPAQTARRAAWRVRLAHRRTVRNHWLRRIERHRPGRIRNAKQLARSQDRVGEAYRRVQQLTHPARRDITMYDAVTVANVPGDCAAFAGYVAGNQWPENYHELRERFPRAQGATITLTPAAKADVLDVEAGGAAPAQVPGWLEREWAAGATRPKVYAALSAWPSIDVELRNRGWSRSKRRRFGRWLADWDGVREIPRGYDGKQYQTGSYDVSVVKHGLFR